MRVLLVEDEAHLAERLAGELAASGYVVDHAADGERADFLVHTESYDAVLLDLGLPGRDGLSLLAAWRQAGIGVPVMVVTARGSWHEKVLGIDTGADDYLAKPFRSEELLARLRGLLRRASGRVVPTVSCGGLELDPWRTRVTLDGQPIHLTAHEHLVLAYLLHHRDRVVSQRELNEHIYAADADPDSNTVEVFIARLRRKLGTGRILTVRGLGYRLVEQA